MKLVGDYFGLSTAETYLAGAVLTCALLIVVGMFLLYRASKRYNTARREYYERMQGGS